MKRLLSPWWALLTLAALVYTFITPPAFLQSIKLNYFDQLIVNQEPVENNIYVARIDELALERYGQYPFPRNNYAEIIEQLYNMGAGLVVWNVMMPETDRLGGDAKLAETDEMYGYGTVGLRGDLGLVDFTVMHHTDGVNDISLGLEKDTGDVTWRVEGTRSMTDLGTTNAISAGLVIKF